MTLGLGQISKPNNHEANGIFLNSGPIPLQRDQMFKKIFIMLLKSIFENIKSGINGCQASHPLLKYYVSKFGGVFFCADSTVQNYEKHADKILERYLMVLYVT